MGKRISILIGIVVLAAAFCQLLLPGIGWPVSQVLAGVIVLATGALMVYKRNKA